MFVVRILSRISQEHYVGEVTYEKYLFTVSAIKGEVIPTHTVNSTETLLMFPFVFCVRLNIPGTGAPSYRPCSLPDYHGAYTGTPHCAF